MMTAGQQTDVVDFFVDTIAIDNQVVAVLDVINVSNGNQVLARRAVRRSEFSSTWRYHRFTLPFTLLQVDVGDQLQVRVWFADTAILRAQQLTIHGATETYRYGGDGIRVKRTRSSPGMQDVVSHEHGAWQE